MAPRSSDIEDNNREDDNNTISESGKRKKIISPEERMEMLAALFVPGKMTVLEGRCPLSEDSPFYKTVVKIHAKSDAKRARKQVRSEGICKNKGCPLYVEKHKSKKAITSTKTEKN